MTQCVKSIYCSSKRPSSVPGTHTKKWSWGYRKLKGLAYVDPLYIPQVGTHIIKNKNIIFLKRVGVREMAQKIRVLVAFARELGFGP